MHFISAFFLTLLLISPVWAQESAQQDVDVKRVYAFATFPGAQTGAAFMTLQNSVNSAATDQLIGAKSKVSNIVEIHQNLINPDDGKMMMRKIKSIELPVGQTVQLKPDGYHVMFIGMKQPLTLNKQFPLTLVFEKAGEIDVKVNVISPGTEPEKLTDLNQNQQASQNPVVEFFQNLFNKKEQPVY